MRIGMRNMITRTASVLTVTLRASAMGVSSWCMTDTCHGVGAACRGVTKRFYGPGSEIDGITCSLCSPTCAVPTPWQVRWQMSVICHEPTSMALAPCVMNTQADPQI
ncbi:hypothetical protein K438DRAFT_1861154 [Mycena galopus ATCC 62051]|nr:hypothetical protein K438DRAFT_1861154 [Mycena galopus ATCC 62051]